MTQTAIDRQRTGVWPCVAASIAVGLILLASFSRPVRARDGESASEKSKEVWRLFVSACNDRASRVHSVSAEATVRRIYAKGGLTELVGRIRKNEEPNYPDKEHVFADEFASWRLDFVNRRVRKESHGAFPVVDASKQPPLQFVQKRELLTFADGKYRSYDLEPADKRANYGAPDATFFEKQAHGFILRDMDRPLCWIGGHFATTRPRADQMDVVSFPASVTALGAVPSQTIDGRSDYRFQATGFKPSSHVIELQITDEHTPRVVSCSLLTGSTRRWTVAVRYEQKRQEIPVGWTYRAFSPSGSLMMEESYQIRVFSVNDAHLDGGIYRHELKRDSTVDVTPENRRYYVGEDGSLQPSPHEGRQSLRWLRIVGAAATVLAAVVALFLVRRRMGTKRGAK